METNMNFGQAIEALKDGKKVARNGWNGKGMWIVLVPGTPNAQLRDGTPYKAAQNILRLGCETLIGGSPRQSA